LPFLITESSVESIPSLLKKYNLFCLLKVDLLFATTNGCAQKLNAAVATNAIPPSFR